MCLGVKQRLGRVHSAVSGSQDTGAIGALQLDRDCGELGWGEPDRCLLGGIDDAGEHPIAIGAAGEPDAHQLTGCFGVQVPPTPGRPTLTHDVEHLRCDARREPLSDVAVAQQLLSPTATGQQAAGPVIGGRGEQGGCASVPAVA